MTIQTIYRRALANGMSPTDAYRIARLTMVVRDLINREMERTGK